MASKTKMYELLRLLNQGAYHNDDVIRAAWATWPALPEETQQDMIHSGRPADTRRARLWSIAWDGGMEYVLTQVEREENTQ